MAKDSRRGDSLLERVVANGDDASAHALLNEFFAGYPVEKLRRLLASDSEQDVRIGAWIASELGPAAQPLRRDLVQLLEHPSRYVRFFAVDSLLATSTDENAADMAAVAQLISDPDSAVRWKVMNTLSRLSANELAASYRHVTDPQIARWMEWLGRVVTTPDPSHIGETLTGADRVGRVFAAIAAVRTAERDSSALILAVESADEEISRFAREHP